MGDFHELKFAENGTAKWSPVPLLTTANSRSSSSGNLEDMSELSTHRNAAVSSGDRSRSLFSPPALPSRKGGYSHPSILSVDIIWLQVSGAL